MRIYTRHAFQLLGLIILLGLAACSNIESEAKYPTGADRAIQGDNNIYAQEPSIFGDGGLFGRMGGSSRETDAITVNSYLWRASLDTLSFMPIASADPFGGTILTDWYVAPESPKERIKLNVLILGKELKATNVKVNVFKQVPAGQGWRDEAADPQTARKLEDAILTRARQYRITDDK